MTDSTKAVWPEPSCTVVLRELAELSGLSEAELRELVDYGALTPEPTAGTWIFSVQSITVARTASRLRREFEVDAHGVAVLLAYQERIRELEAQLCALRARFPQ